MRRAIEPTGLAMHDMSSTDAARGAVRLGPRLGLRLSLLFALLPLLLLPWIGLRFIERMSELARDDRLEIQAVAARNLATALHERRDLFGDAPAGAAGAGLPTLTVEDSDALAADDRLRADPPVLHSQAGLDLPVQMLPDTSINNLFAVRVAMLRARAGPAAGPASYAVLIEVGDDRFVRDDRDASPPLAGDTLELSVGETAASMIPQPVRLEPTERGWRAIARLTELPGALRVRASDVDYIGRRRIEAELDSGPILVQRPLADTAPERAQRLAEIVKSITRGGARVSVYGAQGELLAHSAQATGDNDYSGRQTDSGWPRRLAAWLLRSAARAGADRPGDIASSSAAARHDSVRAGVGAARPGVPTGAGFRQPVSVLSRALAGVPAQLSVREPAQHGLPGWRLSSAHPIWNADQVVGALVLEEHTATRLAGGIDTLERLSLLAAFALAATVVALALIASVTVSRIVRLRNAADQAIDARGRVVADIKVSRVNDEIGALGRSYSAVLTRLREHQEYLGKLRSRLVHELRTPVMVVRSSLDNLVETNDPAQIKDFVGRARGGAARLERILSSMSEAANLESMLADSGLEDVDLVALAGACVEGYRGAFAPWRFELDAPLAQAPCRVVPESIAQALDKLVANAIDFATPGTPIKVAIRPDGWRARRGGTDGFRLSVINQGPGLPAAMRNSLFESMVSVRPGDSNRGTSHLGLGLYVVRLVAEFHGGAGFAHELPDGVEIGFVVRSADQL